jgi:ribosomal-protein-alanine N-acetyltransferase
MLEGTRVRLRTLTGDDIEEWYRRRVDLANRGDYFPLGLRSEATHRNGFAKDGFWGPDEGLMAIVDELEAIVGYVHFERVVGDVDELELRLSHLPRVPRARVCRPALGLFVSYLFATRADMNRARLDIHPDNAASIRVAVWSGFPEGRIRQGRFHRGRRHDTLVYGLVRSDLDKLEA